MNELAPTRIVAIRAGSIPASVEMMAAQIVQADDLAGLFPPETSVYIPDMGSETTDLFVQAARTLLLHGYRPVPHIATRRIVDTVALEARVARLAGEAGVDDVLVIGGGVDRPAGAFASSIELLEAGILDKHGIRRIGVAGHPEGSPDFSAEAAMEALRLKHDFAQRTDAAVRIVTQFAFDPERIVRWIESLDDHGVDLPVHVGLAGPCKLSALMKYAALCGVGNSLSVLKKQSWSMITLATGFSPESVARPIEDYWRAHPEGPVKRLHVFTFGGRRKTAEWLRERGSWPASAGE